jgi:uncharacterized membrane protein YkvA (DUF1232 family)
MPALSVRADAAGLLSRSPSLSWVPSVSPLVEQSPPVERRLRVIARDAIRGVRRSLKYSVYLVTNSPTWWWRRAKRLFWPVIFATAALFFDTGLLSAWKNEGARVLASYVPMMLYVYAYLFFSRGASVLARLGVVAALVYGVWRRDLIVERGWMSLDPGRLDDLLVIVVAVRVFVATCPQELVEHYAQRAIAIRRRIGGAAPTQTP